MMMWEVSHSNNLEAGNLLNILGKSGSSPQQGSDSMVLLSLPV